MKAHSVSATTASPKLFSIPFDRTRYPLKPEHARNWEISLSHDFTRLLPKMRYADVRLTYFHNKTRNVIDRNYTTWQISNYDKQVISGLELQTRFDNGRVFGDLGMVRNMKTKSATTAPSNSNMMWKCLSKKDALSPCLTVKTAASPAAG